MSLQAQLSAKEKHLRKPTTKHCETAQSAKRFPVKSQIVRCNTKIGKFWQILGFFYQKQEVDLFAVQEA